MQKVICREFNVSQEWLATGEGDMFAQVDDSMGALFNKLMMGDDEGAVG